MLSCAVPDGEDDFGLLGGLDLLRISTESA